jgi:hypothetical protein
LSSVASGYLSFNVQVLHAMVSINELEVLPSILRFFDWFERLRDRSKLLEDLKEKASQKNGSEPMNVIDRRSALRGIFYVAAAASLGATLLPDTAEAMPFALEKDLAGKVDELKHEAQVGRPPPRPDDRLPHGHRRRHHRRRRRWECWWRRGRRVCGYRDWR